MIFKKWKLKIVNLFLTFYYLCLHFFTHRTEIKRIKYMLRVYLRTRLKKIETFVLHILNSEELYARLSEQEQEFARGYTDAMDQLFTSSVLSHVPKDFDSLLKQSAASEGQDMGTITCLQCCCSCLRVIGHV